MEHCILLVEHAKGTISPGSYELVTAAQALCAETKARMLAVVMGSEVASLAEAFSGRTGVETVAIDIPQLTTYHSEIVKSALLRLCAEFPPTFLIACHSTQGLDTVPALAVALKAGCLTAIENIAFENSEPVYQRSICGGKLITHMTCSAEITLLTIQPGAFKKAQVAVNSNPSVVNRNFVIAPDRIANLGVKESDADNSTLNEARIIVAAGRGIEEEENIDWIRRLAALFDRSTVAGSRPLCDLGWLPYSRQVGVTGATVSPELYIACGISGTFQHTVGMRASGYIISINKDSRSPIFNLSDLCIVEDVTTFVPLIIETYENLKARS